MSIARCTECDTELDTDFTTECQCEDLTFKWESDMKSQELRIGNLILVNGVVQEVIELPFPDNCTSENTKPIPLTEEWLLKRGGYKMPFPTITDSIFLDLRRNTVLTVSNLGTGSEMVWLCEKSATDVKKIDDVICVRNFDYDGRIHVHELQNLYYVLTKKELTLTN